MPEEWREIVAEWKGETTFIAKNSSGGSVQMGPFEGRPGIGPMQLLLAGLAGCTGMDVASILLKKRQALKDLKVQVRGKMAEDLPRVFTEIEVTYLLWGEDLDPDAIEHAIQLSEEKYCSVGIMLRSAAPVRTKYRVLLPGEEDRELVEVLK